jgi:hypothetical protein
MKDWLGVPKMHFNANISANEYIGRKNKAKEIKNQMDMPYKSMRDNHKIV